MPDCENNLGAVGENLISRTGSRTGGAVRHFIEILLQLLSFAGFCVEYLGFAQLARGCVDEALL